VEAIDADLALPLDGHPAQPGAPMVRLELSAGAAATMIRRAVIGSLLMPALACASIDGADQGRSSLDGDASSTHTGGRASEGGGGSMVSGGTAGASGSTTAPSDADLPCDCTRPCPLNCDLREELKPSHRSVFDWPCGKARDDDFLLECYSPYAVDGLVLFRNCEYIGVRSQFGLDRRMYTDWYDAVTHELVGWEVWDSTMSPSPFRCYGVIPPPPWECDGPECSVSCGSPGRSCSLSDLVPGDASTGDLDAAMSGGG
jgi:hypothetical protein